MLAALGLVLAVMAFAFISSLAAGEPEVQSQVQNQSQPRHMGLDRNPIRCFTCNTGIIQVSFLYISPWRATGDGLYIDEMRYNRITRDIVSGVLCSFCRELAASWLDLDTQYVCGDVMHAVDNHLCYGGHEFTDRVLEETDWVETGVSQGFRRLQRRETIVLSSCDTCGAVDSVRSYSEYQLV